MRFSNTNPNPNLNVTFDPQRCHASHYGANQATYGSPEQRLQRNAHKWATRAAASHQRHTSERLQAAACMRQAQTTLSAQSKAALRELTAKQVCVTWRSQPSERRVSQQLLDVHRMHSARAAASEDAAASTRSRDRGPSNHALG